MKKNSESAGSIRHFGMARTRPGQEHHSHGASAGEALQMSALEGAHLQPDVEVQGADSSSTYQKPRHIVKLKVKCRANGLLQPSIAEGAAAPAPSHDAVSKVEASTTASTTHASSRGNPERATVIRVKLGSGSKLVLKRALSSDHEGPHQPLPLMQGLEASALPALAQGSQDHDMQQAPPKRPRLSAQLHATAPRLLSLAAQAGPQQPVALLSYMPTTRQQPAVGPASTATSSKQSTTVPIPPPAPCTLRQLTEAEQEQLALARSKQATKTLLRQKRHCSKLFWRRATDKGRCHVEKAERKKYAKCGVMLVPKLPFHERKHVLRSLHSNMLPAGCKPAWQPPAFGCLE